MCACLFLLGSQTGEGAVLVILFKDFMLAVLFESTEEIMSVFVNAAAVECFNIRFKLLPL